MTKNYLALDVGNVVLDMNFDSFLSHLSKTLNISHKDAWSFLERTQKLHDLGFTLIRDEIRDHFKIHSEDLIEGIMESWSQTLQPNEGVIRWAESLLDRGVKIALVSNMGHEHLQIMRHKLGGRLYDESVRFFSAEVGARKPQMIFYHLFLSLYPDWKGSIYLDDNDQNVEAGAKFGLRSISFDLLKMGSAGAVSSRVLEIERDIFQPAVI